MPWVDPKENLKILYSKLQIHKEVDILTAQLGKKKTLDTPPFFKRMYQKSVFLTYNLTCGKCKKKKSSFNYYKRYRYRAVY